MDNGTVVMLLYDAPDTANITTRNLACSVQSNNIKDCVQNQEPIETKTYMVGVICEGKLRLISFYTLRLIVHLSPLKPRI